MKTPLQVLAKFAEDMASLGHDGDLVLRIPPRVFEAACSEAKHLTRFSSYLPPETSVTSFGATGDERPSVLKFAAPCGWVTVIPEGQP